MTLSDNTIWQGCVLAIVAGYADAVGFLTFGAFAGAMTGNTVLLGIALAGADFGAAAQSVLIIAAFLGGATHGIKKGDDLPPRRAVGLEVVFGDAAAAHQSDLRRRAGGRWRTIGKYRRGDVRGGGGFEVVVLGHGGKDQETNGTVQPRSTLSTAESTICWPMRAMAGESGPSIGRSFSKQCSM